MSGLFNNSFLPDMAADCLPILLDAALKGVVILAVATGAILLMRRTSAAARHLVWFMAVFCLLLVPVLSVALPSWQVLPQWIDLNTETSGVPAVAPTSENVAKFSSMDFATDSSYTHTFDAVSASANVESMPNAADTTSPVGTSSLSEPVTNNVWSKRSLHPAWLWVLGAWGLGALMVMMSVCLGILSLLRVGRKAKPITDDSWLNLIDRLSGELGLKRSVVVLKSDQRLMPMTWGTIKPKLLLPEKVDSWQTDRKQLVLLHELAHVKRADYLLQLITQLACALYWFNPLIWIASRCMVTEREQACDDLVLNAGPEPTDYAEELLQIVSGLHSTGLKASAAIAMARPSNLEARLRVILDATRNRRRLTRTAIIACLLTIVCIVLPLASMQPKAKADNKTSESTIKGELKKEDGFIADQNNPTASSNRGERVIHFPKDRSLGRVVVQDANVMMRRQAETFDHRYWSHDAEYLCEAQGDVVIPADKEVGLYLNEDAIKDLSPLLNLKPDDLYMLSADLYLRSRAYQSGDQFASDNCMPYITHLAGLRELILVGWNVTDKDMKHITKLGSLERLSLPNSITNRGLSFVVQLESLKGLYFVDNKVTNAGLKRYLPKLTKLEQLSLGGEHISDAGLECLADLPALRYLNIRYGNFTDAGMTHVKKCTSLKILDLINLPITDTGVHRLSGLTKLEDLNLAKTQVTDRGLAYLKSLPSLKKLSVNKRNNRIDGKPQISDDGMVHIKEIKSLEFLDMYNVDLTDKGLTCLGQMPKLKKLGIPAVRYNNPKDNKYWYSDDGLAELAKLPQLENLFIGSEHITDTGMTHLSKLKKLKVLKFSHAPGITNNGLAELRGLEHLERLNLACKNVTISGLSHLNEFKNLSYLSVRNIKQDNSGLDISGLTNLETFWISLYYVRKGKELVHDPLRDEDLSCLRTMKNLTNISLGNLNGSLITDAGIANFKDLPKLNQLHCGSPYLTDQYLAHLSDSPSLNHVTVSGNFTDDGLNHLEDLKTLRTLKIYSANNFSPAALQQLRDNLPNLRSLTADQNREIGKVLDTNPKPPPISRVAPAFKLKTLDGKEIKLADYRGKAVVLYFWATWCAPCVASTPQLKEFYAEMKNTFGDDFEMISLSMDDYEPKVRDYVAKNNLTWPQVRIGMHSKVSADFGVNDRAPISFLIGPDGTFLLTPESPDDSDEKVIIAKALKTYSSQPK